MNELQRLGISIQQVNRQTLDNKAQGEVHQGIIAKVVPQKN
ncbi:23S rRNA (guanosine-2'-O-)-methyltransferase [Actinobacillus equuli]|nr:23S rRNA (guanosine-2'-O-)-methyltransferase [Actinobacillus equuli]